MNCAKRSAAAGDHGETVIGTDCDAFGQLHDLLLGILFLRLVGGGAISEENVGASFADVPTVGIAAGGRLGAIGTSGELRRLLLQRGPRPGPDRFRLGKHLQGIVAGRIGLRRRGGELDRRIEHALEQARAVDLEASLDQRAKPVAREQLHGPAFLRRAERLRMFHVGRGEHVGTGTAGDLIFQQSGRTVFGLHIVSSFRLERLRHLAQGGAETARSVELDRVGAAWSAHEMTPVSK